MTGGRRKKQEADQVELLARSGKRTGCGKHCHAGVVEKTQKCHEKVPPGTRAANTSVSRKH